MEDLLPILNKETHLKLVEFEYKFLIVFASLHYETNDFEIISNVHRKYIIKKLDIFDLKWSSGKELKSKDNDLSIYFPKVRTNEIFPLVKELNQFKNSIIAITPTQMAYYYLQDYSKYKEDLIDLIYGFPINIEKLIKHLPSIRDELLSIKKLQAAAISETALKYKAEIDLTF